jgi:hypothetical protein
VPEDEELDDEELEVPEDDELEDDEEPEVPDDELEDDEELATPEELEAPTGDDELDETLDVDDDPTLLDPVDVPPDPADVVVAPADPPPPLGATPVEPQPKRPMPRKREVIARRWDCMGDGAAEQQTGQRPEVRPRLDNHAFSRGNARALVA